MRRVLSGVAALGMLVCCVAATGAPQDGFTLPDVLQGRARIVNVDTPSLVNPARDPFVEAETPIHPANIRVEVINDEAFAAGMTATDLPYEAVVFNMPYDSGYGWFFDNTPGTVQWHRMFPGNAFNTGADMLSSFVATVYVSSYNRGAFNATGGFTIELWDGDPYAIQDTVCNGGAPAVIPGTTCSFSDLPENVVYNLKCVFPTKIAMGCDRVFGVVWPGDVCRWSWRLSEGYITGGASYAPTVGSGDAQGGVWACEQYGYCATASGYNAGVCCDDVSGDPGEVACDHTATDPGAWIPDGGCNPTGAARHAAFCQDDAADYVTAYEDEAPLYYNNFVGQLLANTDLVIKVLPVSVDGPAPNVPSDVSISGNTVTIDQSYPGGERHLWFELRVSDWDTDLSGDRLKAWVATLDSSGYTAGLACTLTPWRPACTTDVDCIAAQGPIGGEWDPLRGGCDLPDLPPNVCAAGFADDERPDWIFKGSAPLGGVDQSTLNYRYGATLLGMPIVSDHSGDKYLGTLTLKTTCDCPAGNFYVGLGLPNRYTSLVGDLRSSFFPMLGVQRADVIFPTGQCCDVSSSPSVCLSDTVTRCACEQLGLEGGFVVSFDPTKTCADGCCDCLPGDHSACADGDACTVNRCTPACYCGATPVEVGPGECCEDTPYDLVADIEGLGAIVSNDDGNQCTADSCSNAGNCAVGDACGVPSHTILEGEPCYDGEPCLTVLDTCNATGACVGTDITAIPCTNDWTCENLGVGARCNLAAERCYCVAPSLNFDVHPSQKPNDACFRVGEPVTVDVYFADMPIVVNGGQFVVEYDPACLDFVSIVPGGDPYTFEIEEIVDETSGTIFYAVGVSPFGGAGSIGADILATITFTKIGVCEACDLCFGGANPINTYLVDDTGQVVLDLETFCSEDILENDAISVRVPSDVSTNVTNCNEPTATVTWSPPTATSSCYDVELDCVGPWAPDDPDYVDPMTGGEIPVGSWDFYCTATSTVCGTMIADRWTVTVYGEVTLDVTLQLSPIIATYEELVRCIKFALFSDCVQDPMIVEHEMVFGGMWDYYPHFTEPIKLPAEGNWICITARDQLHTLRSCDYLECVDGIYTAVFKGDPFFGGNWLVGGNLDGFKKGNPSASHDIIDILDFGQFVAAFGDAYGTGDTPCGTQGPHADINGDGVVDALDFSFVSMNFLASSKQCCCSTGGVAGATTEISIEDLRSGGMGELAAGDLNGDGMLNTNDMRAFTSGLRPAKAVRQRPDAGVR